MSTSAECCKLRLMPYAPDELRNRALTYCSQYNLQLAENLGHGLQGEVYAAKRESPIHESAIKVHAQNAAYLRERNVYRRLARFQVRQIRGLTLPTLLNVDDSLLVVEMTLVRPPFILDFGGAYLDEPAPHSVDPNLKLMWIEEKTEQFLEDWPKVTAILADLETKYGIFVADVNPGNIRFHESKRSQ